MANMLACLVSDMGSIPICGVKCSMQCERCGNSHDASYGSGRFCGDKCARGFSTSLNRKAINERISKKLKGTGHSSVTIVCAYCEKDFIVSWSRRHRKYCCFSHASRAKKNHGHHLVDWSSVHRLSYARGRKHAGGDVGWFNYQRVDGSSLKVQGSYELRASRILDAMLGSTIKRWSYASRRFPYRDCDGNFRTYIVDFEIEDLDGHIWFLETKGREIENDTFKWKAVKEAGFDLVIWRKQRSSKRRIENWRVTRDRFPALPAKQMASRSGCAVRVRCSPL